MNSSDVDCLHRLDLTRMTMTGGVSKRGTFGAVARIRDGVFPTFVLSRSCEVKEVTRNGNLVLLITNPIDRASLHSLQNSLVVILFAMMPMTHGMTSGDAASMVRHVVGDAEDGVHLLVCVTPDEEDAVHRPTRVHLRHANERVDRDIGLQRLRVGQRVYPIFHVSGASMDPSCDRLVPQITVSDVIVCCDEGAGDAPLACTPT